MKLKWMEWTFRACQLTNFVRHFKILWQRSLKGKKFTLISFYYYTCLSVRVWVYNNQVWCSLQWMQTIKSPFRKLALAASLKLLCFCRIITSYHSTWYMTKLALELGQCVVIILYIIRMSMQKHIHQCSLYVLKTQSVILLVPCESFNIYRHHFTRDFIRPARHIYHLSY